MPVDTGLSPSGLYVGLRAPERRVGPFTDPQSTHDGRERLRGEGIDISRPTVERKWVRGSVEGPSD